MTWRFGFVIEQHSGHVTFHRLLRAAVDETPDVVAQWHPLSLDRRSPIEALPPLRGNWAARASVRARGVLARHRGEYDALLFHMHGAALLSVGVMRQVPTLISIDATGDNYSEVARAYGHPVGSTATEAVKRAVVRRALRAAHGVVAWSDWVRRSLLDDYRIAPERILLIPAGTDVDHFRPRRAERDGPPRVLFVAADFERKGGRPLLDVARASGGEWELDVVTRAPVEPEPGVRVHRGVEPGSSRLAELYAGADVFALPTLGDCSPHVLLEAMAAGLPVVTTRVGAIPEIVRDGETGLVVERGDDAALAAALARLVRSEPDRARMGAAGRRRAEAEFDARRNARAVLDAMREAAANARR